MPDTLLLTGGNGYVGYGTAVEALRQGYNVRAAVRRQDAIDTILRGKSAQSFHANGALTFSIVPDMTSKRAFVDAAAGCTAILHVASPMGISPGDLAAPTAAGINAVLHAAEMNPSVRRIVWTGSLMGNVPLERQLGSHADNVALAAGNADDVEPLTSQSIAPLPQPVSAGASGNARYSYAKNVGTHTLHEYASAMDDDPEFQIVILLPTWVMGPSELQQTKAEAMDGLNTNSLLGFVYGPFISYGAGLLGKPEHLAMMGATVHVDDVAEAHVRAVTVPVEGALRSFLLTSNAPSGPVHNVALEVLKRDFPDEVRHLSKDAHHGTIAGKFNVADSERDLLGHAFKSYETLVHEFFSWYIDLPGEKRGIIYK